MSQLEPVGGLINNMKNSSLENETFMENETLLGNNNNTREPSSVEFRYPLSSQIVIILMYNMVFVSAVLGNLLVVYVVFRTPRMRTVTNLLIANLSFCDLLMALLCVPFSYIPIILQYWPFGEFLCRVVAPAQAASVFASAYTLVVLAIDRYVAILYPLKPRMIRSQAISIISVVWSMAIVTAVPIMVMSVHQIEGNYSNTSTPRYLCDEDWENYEDAKFGYDMTLMILQYFFPLAVLIFTYSRIAVAVWGKRAPGEAEDARDRRLARAKRKTVVMSLTVVAGYTLAWLPINLMQLSREVVPHVFAEQTEWMMTLFLACHWSAMAHSTFNPVIYGFLNVKFREAFKSVLSECGAKCRVKSESNLTRSSTVLTASNLSAGQTSLLLSRQPPIT